jgi:hypothetical protein
MVREYDRTCLTCYKTSKPGSTKCEYCGNDLPYKDLEEELPNSRETRRHKEIEMVGGSVELSEGFKTLSPKEMRKKKLSKSHIKKDSGFVW